MGQQLPTAPTYTLPTFQKLEQHVDRLFTPQDDNSDQNSLHQALIAVLDDARFKLPAEMGIEGMQINLVMLKVLYQQGFVWSIMKLLNLLSEKLQQLNKRNFLLIKRQELIFLLNLTNFILFFTDQKLAQTLHSLTFRKDLTQETLTYIHQLQNKGMKFNPHKHFLDKLTPVQAQQLHEILQKILVKLIAQRTHILARSSLTFEVISQIQPCLFMLLIKLIKSPFHSKNFWAKIRKGSSLKYHLRIGQYFLGQGCDKCRPSIYQPAVLLLTTLIDKNSKNLTQIDKQIGSVPSHLFKNIPIPLKNTFYHFIAMSCLFSLAFVKDGSEYYVRFSFNRIPTFILLGALIGEKKVTSAQMTEYLEKVCLQTKIGSIERGFMTMMVEKYNKLVKEKIKDNKRMEEVKKTTSGFTNKFLQKVRTTKSSQKPSSLLSCYSTQSTYSQILQKYLLSGSQPYTIKFSSRRYTITPGMLVQEFQRNDQFVQNELKALCERFTYESVLERKIMYKYIDSVQWTAVLPRIIKGHSLVGQEVREGGEEKMGGRREMRVVGSMPVIVQRYLGNKGEEKISSKSDKSSGESSMKNSKKKNKKTPYLQTQAAQNIYQQTSQDQRAQDFKRQLRQIKMLREQQSELKGESQKKAPNGISLVFEEQQGGEMDEQIDEKFQTSELELNKHKRRNRDETKQDAEDDTKKQQTIE